MRNRERWVVRLLLCSACAIGLVAVSREHPARASAIPPATVARLASIATSGVPLITSSVAGLQRPLKEGVNLVVTASTTPTAVEHATLCGVGGNATLHNLSATPLCTGYSPTGATLTCNPGAGGTGIGVCSDLTKCVGTARSTDVGRGVMFYMVNAGTLANVVIECAGVP